MGDSTDILCVRMCVCVCFLSDPHSPGETLLSLEKPLKTWGSTDRQLLHLYSQCDVKHALSPTSASTQERVPFKGEPSRRLELWTQGSFGVFWSAGVPLGVGRGMSACDPFHVEVAISKWTLVNCHFPVAMTKYFTRSS